MPLADIQSALQAHLAQPLDPHEGEMTRATMAFVEREADCLWRTCRPGHLTGSAWVVSPDRRRVLLVHHRKLDRWLQPGGHADGDEDLGRVACREVREETGVGNLKMILPGIFDLDVHEIPARGAEPAHRHYDLRYLFEADPAIPLVVTRESRALAWVELGQVAALNSEASLGRMVGKTARFPAQPR
jgi:8-oxo-dGTP pyrophosphatase MutT (NUDIX family)